MLTFSYKARDKKTGKVINSTIQAESEAAAARILMAQSIVPTEINVMGRNEGSFGGRIKTKDRVIFTRQLATMLNAGLPLTQSLTTVAEQTANRSMKQVVMGIVSSISAGATLGDSFAKYPKVFNNVYIALVHAGEASGTLDKSLQRLADQQEHDADMMSKIRGAMVYPAIVLAVIIAVIVFMMVMLVPQVKSLYSDMGKELPMQTLILVAIVDFFGQWWFIIIPAMIGMIVLLRWWIMTDSGRKTWDTIKLNMPLFSPLFRKMYMARFSRTSETLLSSGVPLLEELKIGADSVGNVVVREEILQASAKVKNGKPLSEGLSDKDYILPFVPQMVKIGEQSGGIDTMFGKVADYYEKEVDNTIKSIQTLIEPILMVVMAFMIGFIVIAILLPIYGLADTTG
ncbi:type II secretion system F family protein [Candidatus Saccharibacteria bacterium]|nr:type II secretion system F family protein [Candidatus Saccharibacteria bacterium]MCL1963285.1 type II secretion system F family protein [Candidatus Saccharibacteria bacterium]